MFFELAFEDLDGKNVVPDVLHAVLDAMADFANRLATARGRGTREDAFRSGDRVVRRLRRVTGDVLLFSSGHFLRVLAARWIGAEPIVAGALMLSTASLSILTYERANRPAIRLWNDTGHIVTSTAA